MNNVSKSKKKKLKNKKRKKELVVGLLHKYLVSFLLHSNASAEECNYCSLAYIMSTRPLNET